MSFQLSGSLDQITLPDLARLLHSSSRTGRLGLESAESVSSLYFEQGNLVDVHTNGSNGLQALKLVGTVNRGKFEFFESLSAPSRVLAGYPTNELIRILETKMQESRQIQELIPQPGDRVKYLGGQLPTDFEVTEQELSICVKTSTGNFVVAELVQEMQIDLWSISYAIARFRAQGILEIEEGPRREVATPPRSGGLGGVVLPPVSPVPEQFLAQLPRVSANETEEKQENSGVPASEADSQPRYWRGRRIN